MYLWNASPGYSLICGPPFKRLAHSHFIYAFNIFVGCGNAYFPVQKQLSYNRGFPFTTKNEALGKPEGSSSEKPHGKLFREALRIKALKIKIPENQGS